MTWGELLRRACFIAWVWYRKPATHNRMVALERELYPELYQPEPREDPLWRGSLAPGAVWPVQETNHGQIWKQNNARLRELAAKGLMESSEFERHKQEWLEDELFYDPRDPPKWADGKLFE